MTTRTAKAVGTVKNTGNVLSSYTVRLDIRTMASPSTVWGNWSGIVFPATPVLAPGVVSNLITRTENKDLLGGDKMEARVVINLETPAKVMGLYISPSISFDEAISYGATWSTSPTVGTMIGGGIGGLGGEVSGIGAGVEVDFEVSVGQEAESKFPWVGMGLLGAVILFLFVKPKKLFSRRR